MTTMTPSISQILKLIFHDLNPRDPGPPFPLKGAGGVPWVQIMENKFECLVVRRGDGGHFAEKFVKKYCS